MRCATRPLFTLALGLLGQLVLDGCSVRSPQRDVTATQRTKTAGTTRAADAAIAAPEPSTFTDLGSDGGASPTLLRDPLGSERIDPDGNDDDATNATPLGSPVSLPVTATNAGSAIDATRAATAHDQATANPQARGTVAAPESGMPSSARAAAHGHFEKVGRATISLRQICDLTTFGGALYAAHALSALGSDGATISRYDPRQAPRPFRVAFDWNRPGTPAKGGGAGQGFLRIRAIAGRLFVPDADPPYNGFGLADWGTEGYVFVSDREGKFAAARHPHYRPPGPPDHSGRPGASVLPRSYHDFDVIRFRGHLIASTGAVPPKERAWVGSSPGALHVANDALSRFEYRVAYPLPYPGGVWRLTYMVRFRDRLYVGIQDYDGLAPHDYVVVAPPRGIDQIAQEHLTPINVTGGRGTQTLRWYTDRHRLYWIAWGFDGVHLRVTDDGDRWTRIALPTDAGAPTDLVRYRDALVVLTQWGLYRIDGDTVVPMARVSEKKSPFELRDPLCAAPLAVFDNELYAGGQRDGSLYRFAAR